MVEIANVIAYTIGVLIGALLDAVVIVIIASIPLAALTVLGLPQSVAVAIVVVLAALAGLVAVVRGILQLREAGSFEELERGVFG
jgi:hypothetical protein